MRTFSTLALVATLLIVPTLRAAAGDLLVPSQYKTIQAALNAARPGDRVLVAPGTYRERIVFPGVALLLQSSHGAGRTVIDAEYKGVAVTFDAKDGPWTMMRGFTVTGGLVEADIARGGGVNCGPASPVVLDNVITGNWVHGKSVAQGGGVYATGAPVFLNNLISDNIAVALETNTDHAGGGVYALGGAFVRNRIIGNTLISNREVWNGVLLSRGAGVFAGGQCGFMYNRVIGNNGCFYGRDARGGGFAVDGQAKIALNVIRNNTARAQLGRGGGIYCAPQAKPIISGNVILENFAESEATYASEGGGVYVDVGAAPEFSYNTVHANRVSGATVRGAGLSAASASPRIVGCIFWNNTHWDEHQDQQVLSLYGVNSTAISYSVIGDGQFATLNHNTRADPLFVDAYHLAPTSPCIDAGEPATPAVEGVVDLEGAERVRDALGGGKGRIDIGALEYGPLRRDSRARVGPSDLVEIDLFAPRLVGSFYLCAASLGDAGIALPAPDTRIIPLSLDTMFQVSLGRTFPPFEGFSGVIGANGRARLKLTVPAMAQLLGLNIHVAGIVLKGSAVDLVTNAVTIGIWK